MDRSRSHPPPGRAPGGCRALAGARRRRARARGHPRRPEHGGDPGDARNPPPRNARGAGDGVRPGGRDPRPKKRCERLLTMYAVARIVSPMKTTRSADKALAAIDSLLALARQNLRDLMARGQDPS